MKKKDLLVLMIKEDQGLSAHDERRSRCSRKIKVIKLIRLNNKKIDLSVADTCPPMRHGAKLTVRYEFSQLEKSSGYVEFQTRMVERLVSSVLTWQPVVSEFVYQ